MTFADDPSYRPGKSAGLSVDTASFNGIGMWNGKKGYRFEARASDRGEPGRHADTLEIVVTAPSEAVVVRVDGAIAGGNIQASR